jgi:glutamate--glyoxylate aminotransferase
MQSDHAGHLAASFSQLLQSIANTNKLLSFTFSISTSMCYSLHLCYSVLVIGNTDCSCAAQALGQPPLTFHREVVSLCLNPDLLNNPKAHAFFAPDAVKRAQQYAASMAGGMGAYTNSQGLQLVREEIADFITARDGHPAHSDKIFLTNGASDGVKLIMQCILRQDNCRDGLLTPIPQYPLYSAALTLIGGILVPYHLNEKEGWGVSLDDLKSSLAKARKEGVCVRGICVINPGNPTGSLLTEQEIKDIIKLVSSTVCLSKC